ncbi:hypothetical protein [Rhodoflexus sp.]
MQRIIMVKYIGISLLLTILLGGFLACQSIRQMRNFAQCAFRLQDLNQFTAAGIDFSGKRSITDFGLADAARLTSALSGNNPFIFSFIANVEVRNPNPEPASLTQMDWILAIDGREVLNGAVNNRVQVAPNGGLATVPVSVNLDLRRVFADQGRDALLGFAFDTAVSGNNSTRLAFKVRPYMNIAGLIIPYPGYITIKKDF